MNYHINRNGEDLGRFTLDEIRQGLSDGKFQPDDLAWRTGMDSWESLRELKDLYEGNAIQPGEGISTGSSANTGERTGPPWEDKESGGFFSRTWETTKGALFNPNEFFKTMRREDGIGQPLLFTVIMGTAFGIIGMILTLPFNLAGSMMPPAGMEGEQAFTNAALGTSATLFQFIITAVLLPVFIAIGAFIMSGLQHLCLMLCGGANRPFETTFRTYCYSSGSAQLFNVIPICGGIIAFFWSLVVNIIGLGETHETDTWKGAMGVLLPYLVCCGLMFLLYIFIFGAIFAAAGAAGAT